MKRRSPWPRRARASFSGCLQLNSSVPIDDGGAAESRTCHRVIGSLTDHPGPFEKRLTFLIREPTLRNTSPWTGHGFDQTPEAADHRAHGVDRTPVMFAPSAVWNNDTYGAMGG